LNSWTLELTEGDGGGNTGGGGSAVTREYAGSGGLSIPDNDSNGVVATIEVGDTISIQDLSVELSLTHTYVGDLKVVLEKDGVSQILHGNEGGSADNIRRTYDTRAFRNMNARGTWSLRIIDSARMDTGTLDGWKLIVQGTAD
jgi:subtilisin-like proprotein convertase family protein